tara:strand:- start:376 stop:678 length:303 start_codon:yes stop_codon:yes gene_type:complete
MKNTIKFLLSKRSEDQLSEIIKSTVYFITSIVCFVWALGETVGNFTKKMITVTYKVFTAVVEAYRSLTAMISGLLDAYHSIPVFENVEKEQENVPQVSGS